MQTQTPTPVYRSTVALLPTPPTAHRTEHGSSQWAMPGGATTLQPQDGLTQNLSRQRRAAVKFVQPQTKSLGGFSSVVMDPEDARLTGGTRSLMRRLLGLNLRKPQYKAVGFLPVTAA